MKPIIKYLLIAIVLFSTKAYAANEENITIPMTQTDDDPGKLDRPSKGHRLLRAPIICTINFAEGTVDASIASEILSYEVWDAEGGCIVASFTTDSGMVEFLSTASGCYQLRLVTDDYSYAGYLEL